MPLELNGQPYTMSDEELRKYSKQMIFRVGKQYIKQNYDPEMKPLDIAPAHVPTHYNHHKFESSMRKSLGTLRYYDAASETMENGREKKYYTPQYIAIGHLGYMKCENPEMNYFLDNHPMNEKVRANSTHPNYDPNKESILSTYSRTDKAKEQLDREFMHENVRARLLARIDGQTYEYDIDRLRVVAEVVVKQANARKIHHKLYDFQDLDESSLRVELLRIAGTHPEALYEMFWSFDMDYAKKISQWRKARVIEYQESNLQWVLNNKKLTEPILTIMNNTDPVASLIEFLKNDDQWKRSYKRIEQRFNEVLENLKKKDPAAAEELTSK